MSTVKSLGMASPRATHGMVRRIQLTRPPALMPGHTSSPITCGRSSKQHLFERVAAH